ncbi:hypothetical protein PISMIDRAFT_9625 [Pisolithus microcarpus 441]|uniref:Uncharacterized protein n=1 Tax=Pisolithus microcarpus 441 TaxID=765257 RepID=A0A0C9ZT45_9AGAM|nr:hypothetical protein PISMIDRAFT_9625 [Pisolithus microcarpus 441]
MKPLSAEDCTPLQPALLSLHPSHLSLDPPLDNLISFDSLPSNLDSRVLLHLNAHHDNLHEDPHPHPHVLQLPGHFPSSQLDQAHPPQVQYIRPPFTQVPGRDRKVNIWKLACQEREDILKNDTHAKLPSALDTPVSGLKERSFTLPSTTLMQQGGHQDAMVYRHEDVPPPATSDIASLKHQLLNMQKMEDDKLSSGRELDQLDQDLEDLRYCIKRLQEDLDCSQSALSALNSDVEDDLRNQITSHSTVSSLRSQPIGLTETLRTTQLQLDVEQTHNHKLKEQNAILEANKPKCVKKNVPPELLTYDGEIRILVKKYGVITELFFPQTPMTDAISQPYPVDTPSFTTTDRYATVLMEELSLVVELDASLPNHLCRIRNLNSFHDMVH